MIICASRRTDIPAFHAEWLMNRLRAGYVLVRNPVCRNLVYQVDLTRCNVDCLVLISKDPRPLLPYLTEIARMGYMTIFQITITPYGRDLEPSVPFKADVADAFKDISDRVGVDRMIWRYDPIILNDYLDVAYHRRKFDMLCRELEGYTHRCTFSFVDMYGKLGQYGNRLRAVTNAEMDAMGAMMVPIATAHGMRLSYCCAHHDLSRFGIEPRGCIDRQQMEVLGIPYQELDKPLRDGCRCVKNIDIGAYDTCAHGCVYCYANAADPAVRSQRVYNPAGELLWGAVTSADQVVVLDGRKDARISDYFDYKQY